MNGPRLAPARGNDPWIVAQVLRIRALETEVKDLFAVGGTPKKFIQRRVAELDSQVTLLDMALS